MALINLFVGRVGQSLPAASDRIKHFAGISIMVLLAQRPPVERITAYHLLAIPGFNSAFAVNTIPVPPADAYLPELLSHTLPLVLIGATGLCIHSPT
jgi:hypothetical protein